MGKFWIGWLSFYFSSILWKTEFCFFFSFRSNSLLLHFHLRLVLWPELLPMMCHTSSLNKPSYVAGANLFRNPNPYKRNILSVIALKMLQKLQFKPVFRHISVLSCIVQTCSSGEAPSWALRWCSATAAPHKNFSWHFSAKTIFLFLFKRLFHVRKYIVLYRNLSQVTTQRISEMGWPVIALIFIWPAVKVQSGKADVYITNSV